MHCETFYALSNGTCIVKPYMDRETLCKQSITRSTRWLFFVQAVRARTPVFGLIGVRMVIGDTVANVDASDVRCRYIGKNIARDLTLVASRLCRMANTQPASRAAVTLSPSVGADHLGCINRTTEKKREESIIQSCRVRTHTKS